MVTVLLWLVLGVYLLGWVLDIRPALRRWMLAEACIECRHGSRCPADRGFAHGPKAPRGAVTDRRGSDAAAAVWFAAWWPLRLLTLWFALLFRTLGRGVGAVVLSGRLTTPELERRTREQQAEIDRLTKEIDEGGTGR